MKVDVKLVVLGFAALAVLVGVGFSLRPEAVVEPAAQPPAPVVATAPPKVDVVAPTREETAEPPKLRFPKREDKMPEAKFVDPEGTVWGHVTDAVNKQPIEFFHTYLMPIEAGDIVEFASHPENRKIDGNDRGAFTYREVAKGKYTLLV